MRAARPSKQREEPWSADDMILTKTTDRLARRFPFARPLLQTLPEAGGEKVGRPDMKTRLMGETANVCFGHKSRLGKRNEGRLKRVPAHRKIVRMVIKETKPESFITFTRTKQVAVTNDILLPLRWRPITQIADRRSPTDLARERQLSPMSWLDEEGVWMPSGCGVLHVAQREPGSSPLASLR